MKGNKMKPLTSPPTERISGYSISKEMMTLKDNCG